MRAQLQAVDRQSGVYITDLSRSGLRGTTDIKLHVGQIAIISLDDFTHCVGTVRWTDDRRFGLKFNKMLDVLPAERHFDFGMRPGQQARMPVYRRA